MDDKYKYIPGEKPWFVKLEIAGVMFHMQKDVKEFGKFDGHLRPEPTNAYDPKAIGIYRDSDGKLIGYVPRIKTGFYHALLEGREWPCVIQLYGPKNDDGEAEGIYGSFIVEGLDFSKINVEMMKYPGVSYEDADRKWAEIQAWKQKEYEKDLPQVDASDDGKKYTVEVSCWINPDHKINMTLPTVTGSIKLRECIESLKDRFLRLADKCEKDDKELYDRLSKKMNLNGVPFRDMHPVDYNLAAFYYYKGERCYTNSYYVHLDDFIEEFKNDKVVKRTEEGYPTKKLIDDKMQDITYMTATKDIEPDYDYNESNSVNLTVKELLSTAQLKMLVNHAWEFELDIEDRKYYEKGDIIGSIGLSEAYVGKKTFIPAITIFAPMSGFYVKAYWYFQMTTLDDARIIRDHLNYLHRNLNCFPSACHVYKDITYAATDDFYLTPRLKFDAFEQKYRIIWMSNKQDKTTYGFSLHLDKEMQRIGFCFNNEDHRKRFNIWYTHGEFLSKSICKDDKLQMVLDDGTLLEFKALGASHKYDNVSDSWEKKLRYAYFDITDMQIERLTQHHVSEMRLTFANDDPAIYFKPEDVYDAVKFQYFVQLYVKAMIDCGEVLVEDRSHFFKKSYNSATAKRKDWKYMSCDSQRNLTFYDSEGFDAYRKALEDIGSHEAAKKIREVEISNSVNSFLSGLGKAIGLGMLAGISKAIGGKSSPSK